jgi:hypothetical protein
MGCLQALFVDEEKDMSFTMEGGETYSLSINSFLVNNLFSFIFVALQRP